MGLRKTTDRDPRPEALLIGPILCGNGRSLTLRRPRIMGVLNITPDSFSDGGSLLARQSGVPDLPRILDRAAQMVAEGASLLDIGGESTRPGARAVSETEECRRVLPVLERLLELDVMVSVDTRKAGLAIRAIAAGAHLINDISGLRDGAMLDAIADSRAAVCIMHMQGEPETMQRDPRYHDVVTEVRAFLAERVAQCRGRGITDDRLVLDPGFGFGKTLAHNLDLLRSLASVRVDALPLLVGLSRKSMIGTITGRPPERRQAGSTAAALLAVQRGASLVRVHDVAEMADALQILQALTADDQSGE